MRFITVAKLSSVLGRKPPEIGQHSHESSHVANMNWGTIFSCIFLSIMVYNKCLYANDCSSSHMYHNAPETSQRPLHLLLQQKLLKTRADLYATALVIAYILRECTPVFVFIGSAHVQRLLHQLPSYKWAFQIAFMQGQTLWNITSYLQFVILILIFWNNKYLSQGTISYDKNDAEKLQRECMEVILQLGLECSQISSRARMHVSNAISKLQVVKDVLLNDWYLISSFLQNYSNRKNDICIITWQK